MFEEEFNMEPAEPMEPFEEFNMEPAEPMEPFEEFNMEPAEPMEPFEEFNMEPAEPMKPFEEEFNMEPAEKVEPFEEFDMRPAKKWDEWNDEEYGKGFGSGEVWVPDDGPTNKQNINGMTLDTFREKHPNLFDEYGNIKTEALEIIDALLLIYKKSKLDDGPKIEMQPIEEREHDRGISF
jgi:hypothetical protein